MMETNNTLPLQSRILAVLTSMRLPVSKDLLLEWLNRDWGYDEKTPDFDRILDEVLNSDEVVQTEGGEKTLYSIAKNKQAEVTARLGNMIQETDEKFADAGLLIWGIRPGEPGYDHLTSDEGGSSKPS